MQKTKMGDILFWCLFVALGFSIGVFLIRRDIKDGFGAISYGFVPEFELTDQNDNPFSSEKLRGKVWVLDFVLSNNGYSQIMTRMVASLCHQFNNELGLHFVTILPDDKDNSLHDIYNIQNQVDVNEKWYILKGASDRIYSLAISGFHTNMGKDPLSFHNTFLLIDQNGIIRGYYTGTNLKEVKRLERDLRSLL